MTLDPDRRFSPRSLRAPFLLLLSVTALFGSEPSHRCLRFDCYAVAVVKTAAPAKPSFAGVTLAANRSFRYAIDTETANGPNFAGSYTLIQLSCGTGCAFIVLVDTRTGAILTDLPFGEIHLGTPMDSYGDISFRVNSSLLVIQGRMERTGTSPVRACYEFSRNRFRVIDIKRIVHGGKGPWPEEDGLK
jgi:hypothetical protein